MSETYDRPNKPGIWQNEARVSLYEFLRSGYWRYYGSLTERWAEPSQPLVEGRWRRIVNEYGKQVCDPDSPWPPKVRIEKRWFYWSHRHQQLRPANSRCKDHIGLNCEVFEDGTIKRVIPFKEGE